jgi:mono/diheme cytochrome c family protein/uncharacterized membrane protein
MHLHQAVHLCGSTSLVCIAEILATATLSGQSENSKPIEGRAPGPSAPAAAGTPAARDLFQKRCVKCHGADGTGEPARGKLDQIPNFTNVSWQKKRSDAQLISSILEGKEPDMPSWRSKVSEEQARGLVALVRSFAPSRQHSEADSRKGFRDRFHRLQERFDRLEQQGSDLTKGSPAGGAAPPSTSAQPVDPGKASAKAAAAPAARDLFQKHCVKCHGADGTGKPARGEMDQIPNFTNASWQKKRSDARLLSSILEGKEPDMPSWRGKVSEEQARGLVAHVRSFAPSRLNSEADSPDELDDCAHSVNTQRQGPASSQSAAAKTPRGFGKKLICWLGTFHPPAVHFPIALLTAAALAGLLRIATGQPAFDTVTRVMVWFGAVAALIAAILGWCLAGFRLTDPSSLLMTHRWLGTATAACAAALLVVSEESRHPDRQRTRASLPVMLVVVAVLVSLTGFLGGSMVFGLDYHAWPH